LPNLDGRAILDLEAAVNVSLTPELEQLVNAKVNSGLYQTASEVVREALRLLRQRDEGLEALRRDVRAGFKAAERGEYTEHDGRTTKALAAEIKALGRRRLVEPKRRTRPK
jgi:antitoxin ParD1/3/4